MRQTNNALNVIMQLSLITEPVHNMEIQPSQQKSNVFTASSYVLSLITGPVDDLKIQPSHFVLHQVMRCP